jgi:hypothetical protein
MSKIPPRAPKIILLRHAEKPSGSDSYGVTKKGKHEKKSLSVRGWQRAGALAHLFAPTDGYFPDPSLAAPQFLYASKPVKKNGSRRPFETILPLADKLSIEINSEFEKFEDGEMLADALAQTGVVLICWQREYLPKIASRILGDAKIAPHNWDENRFDLIWVFERDSKSGEYRFKQVPQNLLAGDSSEPIK